MLRSQLLHVVCYMWTSSPSTPVAMSIPTRESRVSVSHYSLTTCPTPILFFLLSYFIHFDLHVQNAHMCPSCMIVLSFETCHAFPSHNPIWKLVVFIKSVFFPQLVALGNICWLVAWVIPFKIPLHVSYNGESQLMWVISIEVRKLVFVPYPVWEYLAKSIHNIGKKVNL